MCLRERFGLICVVLGIGFVPGATGDIVDEIRRLFRSRIFDSECGAVSMGEGVQGVHGGEIRRCE